MERELPIYEIDNVKFLVDVDKGELREKSNPRNVISFYNMNDKITHYEITWNRAERNQAKSLAAHHDTKVIKIPTMMALDAEGMSIKYKLPEGYLKGKTDFEIIVNPHSIKRRQSGIWPKIDVAGNIYDVNVADRMLIGNPNDNDLIYLSNLILTADEQVYFGLYDAVNRLIIDVDILGLKEFPKNVMAVEIPHEKFLDPFGYASIHRFDNMESWLRRYPPGQDLVAKVTPLIETHLGKLLEKRIALTNGNVKNNKGHKKDRHQKL